MKNLFLALESAPLLKTCIGQVIRARLGIGRRYGVRYARGTSELTGYVLRSEAARVAKEKDGIVFMYEPLDMRIRPYASPTRSRYVG